MTGLWINAEDDDAIGILISGEEPLAGGIEREIARSAAEGGDALDFGEQAGAAMDGEDGDAIVAAIGSVEKFSGGSESDLRRGALAGEALGKRGNGLQFS